MSGIWLIRLVFGGVYGASALYALAPDGDFPWQRWLGATILTTHHVPQALGRETFTAVGAPWLAQEWLYGIVAALTSAVAGYAGFAVLIAACALLALLLVERRTARRGVRGPALALCVGLAGVATLESFGARAQVAVWPCFAALLLALDEEGWRAWMAVPLAALWSNLHASAVIAPILVLLDAMGRALEARGVTRAVRNRLALAGVVAAATWCNPFGWNLDLYAIQLMRSPIVRAIQEWRPARIDDLAVAAGVLPLVLLVAMGLRARLLSVRELPLTIAVAALAFEHLRNVPLAGMALAPSAGAWLSHRWPAVQESATKTRAAFAPGVLRAAFVALAAVLIVVATVLRARYVPPRSLAPRGELAYLAAEPGVHRLLCEDFAWCSAAIGVARVRVFVDSRADPYPARVWRDYLAIIDLGPAWRRRLAAWGVDAIIARRGGRFARAVGDLPGWRRVRSDARYVLYETTPMLRRSSRRAM